MLAVVRESIPRSKVNEVYLLDYGDLGLLKDLMKKTYEIFMENPDTLRVFKDVDLKYVWSYLREALKNSDPSVKILLFKRVNGDGDDCILGASLVSWGSPWYAPKITVLSEECTVSFVKGSGIANALIYTLENGFADVDIIQASNANAPCRKLLDNSYTRLGMDSYKTFYKDLRETV